MSSLSRAARPMIRSTSSFSRRTMASSTPRKSGISNRALSYALLGTTLASAYTLGALYPVDLFTLISPRVAPPPPPPDHPDAIALVERLEKEIHELPLLRKLRSMPDSADWYESRPYARLPEERRVNNLTAGALRGAGRLAVPPVCRAKNDESESYIFIHVGRGLCGHDGIIHGGLIATLLDETLARTAILNLPEKIGVTANLSINYRAPTKADQFIVIKTKLVESKGRKASVSGVVQDMSGNTLAEAAAIFVQPRCAKLLSAEALHEAMGHPTGHARDATKEEVSIV
ncbi:Thioesterase/thiol ester dehydrase-isomerase [Peniophora sp. CONT]|nr:Thioesterase/thiol ester dehydrase-isomerase [Peniophora sp. CONT]